MSTLHPLLHILLQRLLALSAALFTTPAPNSSSSISSPRSILVFLIFLTTYSHLATCHLYMENRTWKSIWGFLSTQFLAVYTERLLVGGWGWRREEGGRWGPKGFVGQGRGRKGDDGKMEVDDDDDDDDERNQGGCGKAAKEVTVEYPIAGSQDRLSTKGAAAARRKEEEEGFAPPVPVPKGKESASSNYDFALSFLFGTRGINKPWQAKNVPAFSSPNYPSHPLPPTRRQFLLRRSITILLSLLTLDIGTFYPLHPKIFDLATIPLFARLPSSSGGGISADEIVHRIANTVANWIVNYAFICFFANSWACFVVAVGWSEPGAWPPGFGSLADAWTLRRFWGKFWHQHFRTTLEGLSAALTHEILHLPRSGLGPRYTKLFLAFAISGCMHIGHDIGGAVEVRRRHGAMRFFCTQFLGIVIEDSVQALWSRGLERRGEGGRAENWIRRWVGYLWVMAFMVWSVPVFQYPVMVAKRPVGDELLPFSVARVVFGKGGFFLG